mmetsp:Transcript_11721/g.27504  ORF Transcript_11721/g.27504 Transcript_11721/m.27504 type:complete len:231 (-) Transcript_11721:366-1058(-)
MMPRTAGTNHSRPASPSPADGAFLGASPSDFASSRRAYTARPAWLEVPSRKEEGAIDLSSRGKTSTYASNVPSLRWSSTMKVPSDRSTRRSSTPPPSARSASVSALSAMAAPVRVARRPSSRGGSSGGSHPPSMRWSVPATSEESTSRSPVSVVVLASNRRSAAAARRASLKGSSFSQRASAPSNLPGAATVLFAPGCSDLISRLVLRRRGPSTSAGLSSSALDTAPCSI